MPANQNAYLLEVRLATRVRKVKKIEKCLEDTIHENEYLYYKVEKLQANLDQSQQYSRLENIEIIGFPDMVKQENLEETVITILKKLTLM